MKRLNFQAVIFDMDGVIFDSEKRVAECWEEVGEKYNIPNIRQTIMKCIGINATATEQVFKETYGDSVDYLKYRTIVRGMFSERYGGGKLPTKPGIRELLVYLRKLGVKIAVASSTRIEKVTEELGDADLLKYFDIVVGGDMVERSKPAPDIFLEAARRLEISPEDAIVIEDSYNGIRAAKAANMIPFMVPDMIAPDEEMKELSYIILESLLDVRCFLDSYNVYPHMCRLCGQETIWDEYDICPVCKWEDNKVQNRDETIEGGANCRCLFDARQEYFSLIDQNN